MKFGNDEIYWAPHQEHGFVAGKVIDIGIDTLTVQPILKGFQPITAPHSQVFPSDPDDTKDVDDNCSLMYLNEATLLHNLVMRCKKDKVYTYVANILISVNPYKELKQMYDETAIKSYQGKSLGVLSPHCYAVADKAYRDMRMNKLSQALIVSGESGAGKTENTKFVLRYLADLCGSGENIVKRIVQANPLLEAFGNAKTVRNNNSSRFGKFVEIHFNEKSNVVGGFVSHYLLEKSRIVLQNSKERNYHVFYRLCCGSSDKLKQALHLKSPDKFKYLSHGCTQYFLNETSLSKVDKSRTALDHQKKGPLKDPLLDDHADFSRMESSMKDIGLTISEIFQLFQIVAGVLHLGNIEFEEGGGSSGGCFTSDGCEESVRVTAKLFELDFHALTEALTTRSMTSAGESSTIKVPLKVQQASNAREALAKSIYSRLFDHIVKKINQCFPFQSSHCFIGVLDIAGFEYFEVNSFEQFCINYCNEKLQQFFNMRVLCDEQELYNREGLGVHEVSYTDNQDCIDLIESPKTGILDILDEESKLPSSSDSHFTSVVHTRHKDHFRISIPRKAQLKKHRNLRDDEGFLIRHFAGAVCYQTVQFVEKNNDALHHSLEELMTSSKNSFVRDLFSSGDTQSAKGKLSFVSVGNKFKKQLGKLLDKLNATSTSFIRCIKPNLQMKSDVFEGQQILNQLQCAGMTSVLNLMQGGYPSRAQFSDLYKMYEKYMPDHMKRLDPRLFCKALFKALGLSDDDYKFGMTKIFFCAGKFAEFDQMMRSDPEHLKELIKKVHKWLINARWRKAQWCALIVVKLKNKLAWRRQQYVLIQKQVRGMIERRKHRPRMQAQRKVVLLMTKIEKMRKMAEELKANKDAMMKKIHDYERDVRTHRDKIKASVIEPTVMEDCFKRLKRLESTLIDEILKKQVKEAEGERLRKIQEEIERERKRKEEEELRIKKEKEEAERRRQEEEKIRKEKLEIEEKRQKELIERKQREEEEKRKQMEIDAQSEKQRIEDEKRQVLQEQERKDREIAIRLAQSEGQQVAEEVVQISLELVAPKTKNAFSKWTYAELRDAINTSTDIEHIEACKVEFHRRLNMYHGWKAKNTARNKAKPEQRAPAQIAGHGHQAVQPPPNPRGRQSKVQRYFKFRFIRSRDEQLDVKLRKTGWWYAHFDGRFTARQLEVHPEKVPLLLVAGKDDLQMFEKTLEETGLTRLKGAEMLPDEFEKVWLANGGQEYLMKAVASKQARPTYATAMLEFAKRKAVGPT